MPLRIGRNPLETERPEAPEGGSNPKFRRKGRQNDHFRCGHYVAEQGCKWRGLPAHFGTWHTISTRMNRWAKKGVLDRVCAELQRLEIMRVKVEVRSLDSTVVKVHPDGTGALEKHGAQALGTSRGGWTPKLHRVAAKDRNAVGFSWSGGQEGDGPQGRTLLHRMALPNTARGLVMDKA